MNAHREIKYEEEICATPSERGWIYEEGAASGNDRARALLSADLVAWVRETEPKAWEQFAKTYGIAAETSLLDAARLELNARGTIDVIRHGIDIVGLCSTLDLDQFRLALVLTDRLWTGYPANKLHVVRQVRYSLRNENAINLVFFLNGLPPQPPARRHPEVGGHRW